MITLKNKNRKNGNTGADCIVPKNVLFLCHLLNNASNYCNRPIN